MQAAGLRLALTRQARVPGDNDNNVAVCAHVNIVVHMLSSARCPPSPGFGKAGELLRAEIGERGPVRF